MDILLHVVVAALYAAAAWVCRPRDGAEAASPLARSLAIGLALAVHAVVIVRAIVSPEGLDLSFAHALSLVAGMLMIFSGIPAIRMLFWAAVVNGLLAPPLIAVILVVCNDRRVMGEWRNGRVLNGLGVIAGLAMTAAGVALLVLSWR